VRGIERPIEIKCPREYKRIPFTKTITRRVMMICTLVIVDQVYYTTICNKDHAVMNDNISTIRDTLTKNEMTVVYTSYCSLLEYTHKNCLFNVKRTEHTMPV
jgi:archaellum component FlaF (FlaF/FlaG flagellin family)